MHSPLITKDGGQRVGCCTGNCSQGRKCVAPQACELPEDDFDPSKPNVLASAVKYGTLALIVAVFAFIGAAPYLFD